MCSDGDTWGANAVAQSAAPAAAPIVIKELAKLCNSQVALTAAYKGGFCLQENGWMRYPAASWDEPAIVAMVGDKCVAVLNYAEKEDDLYVNVSFAFCDAAHPRALVGVLSRFRSKFRGSKFERITFTCHNGNTQMAKAVALLGLAPKSMSYEMPVARLGSA
jgi:hypothetical protein